MMTNSDRAKQLVADWHHRSRGMSDGAQQMMLLEELIRVSYDEYERGILNKVIPVLEFYGFERNHDTHYSRSVDANGEQVVYDPVVVLDSGKRARELLAELKGRGAKGMSD